MLGKLNSLYALEELLLSLGIFEECAEEDDSISFTLKNHSDIEVYISKREGNDHCYLSVTYNITSMKRITFDNFDLEWNAMAILTEMGDSVNKVLILKK